MAQNQQLDCMLVVRCWPHPTWINKKWPSTNLKFDVDDHVKNPSCFLFCLADGSRPVLVTTHHPDLFRSVTTRAAPKPRRHSMRSSVEICTVPAALYYCTFSLHVPCILYMWHAAFFFRKKELPLIALSLP